MFPADERGRDLPARDGDGEVPRRDRADDADRLADAHLELVGHLRRRRLAEEAAALAGHVVGHVDRFLDVAAGLGAHLAHLAHHQLGQLVLAVDEPLARPGRGPRRGCGAGVEAPALVGLLRGLDGAVDVGHRTSAGTSRSSRRVAGFVRLERLVSGGVDPLAADVVLRSLCRCGRHLAPCRIPPPILGLRTMTTVGDNARRTRRVRRRGHRALHGTDRRPQPAPLRRGGCRTLALRRDHRPGRHHDRPPERRRRRGPPRSRQRLPARRLELQGTRRTRGRDHGRGRGARGPRGQADHEAPHDHLEPGGDGRPRRHGAGMDRADLAPGRGRALAIARRGARPGDDDVVLGLRGRAAAARRLGLSDDVGRVADDRRAARLRGRRARLERPQPRRRGLAARRDPRAARWAPPARTRSCAVADGAGAAHPAPLRHRLLPRRRLPAGAQAHGDVVPARARTALGVLVGALTLGSALPHLVNGLGGLDWQIVVLATSALTLRGRAPRVLAVRDGPYPFPRGAFDPRQAGRVFRNRGVRLASLGYFGHMWELYAMWAWFARLRDR